MEHSVLGHRWVYDGPHDPVYAAQLLELLQGRVRAQSSKVTGAVEESVVGVPQPSWGTEVHVRTSRVLSGEQSNTSVILDGDLPDGHHTPLIVKVFRMLSPGDNPDVVLQGALVDAGSRRVPAVVGSVTGHWPHPGTEGDQPASGHLAFAQEFLPGVEDAWRVALHAAEAGTDFAEPARALGEATAEVHRTLAEVLGTEPTSREQVTTIVDEMRARFEAAVAEAPELEDVRGPVDAVLRAAADAHWPALQRIHGDYHLGQVLHSPERGWVLLDFEGEPLRPLSERSLPDQWVRDVAGMLRSFDYVGGTREQADGGSARDWVTSAQQAFLDGYAARAGEDPRVARGAARRLRARQGHVRGRLRGPQPARAGWPSRSAPSAASPPTSRRTPPRKETRREPHAQPRGRAARSPPSSRVATSSPTTSSGSTSSPGACDFGCSSRSPSRCGCVSRTARSSSSRTRPRACGPRCAPTPRAPWTTACVVAWADGIEHVQDDPYRFAPTLGEVDLHLVNEGRHEQLWTVLGRPPARVRRADGQRARGVVRGVGAAGQGGARHRRLQRLGRPASTRCG